MTLKEVQEIRSPLNDNSFLLDKSRNNFSIFTYITYRSWEEMGSIKNILTSHRFNYKYKIIINYFYNE